MNKKRKDTKTASSKKIKAEVLAVGVDVHSNRYVFRHQFDGGQPKPASGMSPDQFRKWVVEQRSRAERIVCCYEAGPFGFGLHRFLVEHGIECLVVAPENWDSRGTKVKTDKVDALHLLRRLNSYLNGNKEAFCVVRVPSEEQEQARCLGRLREQLKDTRQRAQKRGKSLLLTQGIKVGADWWKPARWKELSESGVDAWLIRLLESHRRVILTADEEERQLKAELESEEKPDWDFVGLGSLTYSLLVREICSWRRFKNRREVGGYTGLCPGVHSSNGKGYHTSVNKHGNPRLRWLLVELAWRVIRYQPDYWKATKMKDALNSSKARRKQAVVAIARQLAVDMWRMGTGQTTPEKLGLRTHA